MSHETDSDKFTVITEVQNELADLIPNFLTNRKNEIACARELLSKSDFSALTKLAHAIKGACMSFGFHAAAKIASAIEHAAQAKDLSSIQACLKRLEISFENIDIHYV